MFNLSIDQQLLPIAQWLFDLDHYFIKSIYLKDLDYFRLDLEFAINQYQKPINRVGLSFIDDLANSHHDLDCAVRNFYAILTSEGKQLLQARISTDVAVET